MVAISGKVEMQERVDDPGVQGTRTRDAADLTLHRTCSTANVTELKLQKAADSVQGCSPYTPFLRFPSRYSSGRLGMPDTLETAGM